MRRTPQIFEPRQYSNGIYDGIYDFKSVMNCNSSQFVAKYFIYFYLLLQICVFFVYFSWTFFCSVQILSRWTVLPIALCNKKKKTSAP